MIVSWAIWKRGEKQWGFIWLWKIQEILTIRQITADSHVDSSTCTFTVYYLIQPQFSRYTVYISKFVKNEKIYQDISRYSAIYQDISRYISIYPELIYFDMSILRYITIYWRKIYPNFWYILINIDISPKMI